MKHLLATSVVNSAQAKFTPRLIGSNLVLLQYEFNKIVDDICNTLSLNEEQKIEGYVVGDLSWNYKSGGTQYSVKIYSVPSTVETINIQ